MADQVEEQVHVLSLLKVFFNVSISWLDSAAYALSSLRKRSVPSKEEFSLFTFLEKPKKTSSCCFSIQSATKYESKDKTHKEFANWDDLMRHGIRNFERSVNFIFQKIEFRTLHDGRNSSDTWNRH